MEFEARSAATGGGGSGYATGESPTRLTNYVLRILALVTTFIAAIVAGVARETEPLLTSRGVAEAFKVKATGNPQFE